MQRIEIDKNEKLINNKFITISFVCSILVIYIHTFNLEIYSIDENSIGIARATYIIETYWSNVLKMQYQCFSLYLEYYFLEHLRYQNFCRNGILGYFQLQFRMQFGALFIMYIMFCVQIFPK